MALFLFLGLSFTLWSTTGHTHSLTGFLFLVFSEKMLLLFLSVCRSFLKIFTVSFLIFFYLTMAGLNIYPILLIRFSFLEDAFFFWTAPPPFCPPQVFFRKGTYLLQAPCVVSLECLWCLFFWLLLLPFCFNKIPYFYVVMLLSVKARNNSFSIFCVKPKFFAL